MQTRKRCSGTLRNHGVIVKMTIGFHRAETICTGIFSTLVGFNLLIYQ